MKFVLRLNGIEVRVGTINAKGANNGFCDKDANVGDMNVLDETYGCEGVLAKRTIRS